MTSTSTASDLEQGTEAWLRWRVGGLGASDSLALVGEKAEWGTRTELLLRKLGLIPEKSINFAMRTGTRLEPTVRMWVQDAKGINFPPVCLSCPDDPRFLASLDGLSDCGTVLEIKCPNKFAHDSALNGLIPRHYKPQLMWQMMVTGAERLIYASHNSASFEWDRHLAFVEVRRDEVLIARLRQLGRTFLRELDLAAEAIASTEQ